MILLLGGSGYVGTAFQQYLSTQGLAFRSLSRSEVDYTNLESLRQVLAECRPEFLINCAGYTGKPNVDACELHRSECLAGNAVLPGTIRQACEDVHIPWGHVSSGCIYTGQQNNGQGFTEEAPPNFSFRTNNCSFYSGSKALGEECLAEAKETYLWRLRIPFNHLDSSRNYLSKVMRYERLLEARNSISHLEEFVAACVQCWTKRVPFGTYNVTNSGSVLTSEVTELIKKHNICDKEFQFFESEEQFMQLAAKTPRSNCVMDNSKLLSTGIHISDVQEALVRSLSSWKS